MHTLSVLPDIELPAGYRAQKVIPTCAASDATQFPIRMPRAPEHSSNTLRVISCDFETTGFDFDTDKPIEIGLVDLTVCADTGLPIQINGVLSQLNDPGTEIPDIVTEITGITSDQLKGQQFDIEAIVAFIKGDAGELPIMAAHNAQFDKTWFEMILPMLTDLPWACSVQDINWSEHNVPTRQLEYLLARSGYYYDAHRATVDCLALAWLNTLHASDFLQMYRRALEPTYLIEAVGYPFAGKDALKSQYKFLWDGKQKVWHKSIKGRKEARDLAAEVKELYIEYQGNPDLMKISTVNQPRTSI